MTLPEQLAFDLLLTDLGLPGMSGAQLVAHVSELRQQMAMAITSGAHAEEAAAGASLRSGRAVFALTKPYDPDVLEALNRQCLAGR